MSHFMSEFLKLITQNLRKLDVLLWENKIGRGQEFVDSRPNGHIVLSMMLLIYPCFRHKYRIDLFLCLCGAISEGLLEVVFPLTVAIAGRNFF